MTGMGSVRFDVIHRFDAPVRLVWDELVDWAGHAEWIPATRVEVAPGDPTAPGARFTAWTGLGRLALEDRMEVVSCAWDDAAGSGTCEVRKLGPVLTGTAGFTVRPDGAGAVVEWREDVVVPLVPRFLAPVVARAGAAGFRSGMKRLGKLLARRQPA
jgi:hypothetical protein